MPIAIPLHEPSFTDRERRYVGECLESGWVSSAGPFVGRFERAVADYAGARHAVATSTGSAALHLALVLAGVRPGDEVIVPDLTFIAPVHVVLQCGALPVLIDADPETWQIDPAKVADFLATECRERSGAAIDRRTGRTVRAIVAVHLLGLACDLDRLAETARRHRLALVEDAAQAIGARHRGRHVGTVGRFGVLSFNGNKTITAGGGGMLLAANARDAERARRLADHGRNPVDRRAREDIGFNYRLSSLQAALGLAQLEDIEDKLAAKRRIAARYDRELAAAEGVRPLRVPPEVSPSCWLYTVRVSRRARDAVVRRLRARGVGAEPLWPPVHTLRASRAFRRHRLEHAKRLWAESVCLPSSPSLGAAEQRLCIEALRDAVAR